MIRLTFVVVAVYGMACGLAYGQGAPLAAPQRVAEIPRTEASAESGVAAPDREQINAMERELVRRTGSLLQESLLTERDPDVLKMSEVSLFAVRQPKPRVLKKHDLVQIIIREESQFSSKGTTDLKKNSDLDAKIDSFVKLNLANLALKGTTPVITPEIKAEFSRNFKGDASVDRSDTMTARIGAEVLDVKPNGTIVVQARKRIKNDEEEQEFVLTGICRAEDVLIDNTVLSTQLHDLDVCRKTKGAVLDTNRRGFVPRLLDMINPF
jgi:flagellar L-ring protein precursor FlgH